MTKVFSISTSFYESMPFALDGVKLRYKGHIEKHIKNGINIGADINTRLKPRKDPLIELDLTFNKNLLKEEDITEFFKKLSCRIYHAWLVCQTFEDNYKWEDLNIVITNKEIEGKISLYKRTMSYIDQVIIKDFISYEEYDNIPESIITLVNKLKMHIN